MEDFTRDPPRPYKHQSTAWLVRELAVDVRELASSGLGELRTEIREELAETRKAAMASLLGMFVALLGSLAVLLGACQLIALTGFPLWASYLVVGVVLFAIGFGLALVAKGKLESVKERSQELLH